jgi:uncharacterized membrane protein YagU involved in acid resistance
MTENVFEGQMEVSSSERPRALDTIFLGGLVVAVLDGLFAFTFYGLILGVKPLRIFQSVAAGLLGTDSFSGGIKTFLLGLLLHFVVASCIATVYYLASVKLPVLVHHAVASGLIYGMIAYLVMKFVVTPLSAIGRRPVPRLSIFLTEIIGHAFLVGLPIALIARRSAKQRLSQLQKALKLQGY